MATNSNRFIRKVYKKYSVRHTWIAVQSDYFKVDNAQMFYSTELISKRFDIRNLLSVIKSQTW